MTKDTQALLTLCDEILNADYSHGRSCDPRSALKIAEWAKQHLLSSASRPTD